MKEKMIDLGNQSFWEEEEEQEQQQQQENQYANKEQLEQHENATKQEQLNESVMTQAEVKETKVSQKFTEMEGKKIASTKAEPTSEPESIIVERKYKYIEGQEDKDYKNVIDTWNYYEENFGAVTKLHGEKYIEEAGRMEARIIQLTAVETNASRYCRWKFGIFMNKNSAKYARYKQVSEMKEFAKSQIKEMKKQKDKAPQRINYEYDDPIYSVLSKSFQKHSLPVRILARITGTIAGGFRELGRKIFGVQTDPHGGVDAVKYNEVLVRHAEFIESLFTKKYSHSEQIKRMEMREDYDTSEYKEEEGPVEEEDQENLNFIRMTNSYHALLDDQQALLEEYKKGSKNKDKIKKLEESIRKRTKDIDEHNEVENNVGGYEYVINTTDSVKLTEELNKYREKI